MTYAIPPPTLLFLNIKLEIAKFYYSWLTFSKLPKISLFLMNIHEVWLAKIT